MLRRRQRGPAWLDVPFSEKDQAKALGARWDGRARRWYAPMPGMAGLERWTPLPELLPGEDRAFGAGLFVDLVPSSCWFSNVRTCVDEDSWRRVRTMVYGRAGHRCEACGRSANKAAGLYMEAHERWYFDERRSVQVLRRLVCLCSACHGVTHLGRTGAIGEGELAFGHLLAVTGMSRREGEDHVKQAFALWEERSLRDWALDIAMVTKAGIVAVAPAAQGARGR